jgi:glycosyltransferase involved in cell wall biosynthesis
MHPVDLITDDTLRRAARGDASRIRSLVEYLAPRTSLRVVFLAMPPNVAHVSQRRRMRIGMADFDWVAVAVDLNSHTRTLANLHGVFAESPASVALLEYVQLTWILDALPFATRAFLDTHQIAHERNERFAAAGLPPPNTIDEAAEYAAFERYERIILIQESDREIVARRLPSHRLLVAPHPVRQLATEIRARARHVGFVGSEYPPNVEGLRWFLDAVWPQVDSPSAELGIFGNVCRRLDRAALPANARCHGLVDELDSAYRTFDIAINPVRVGGGLKIKTVEALGAGLPLVTTDEGARGLEDGAGTAFLLAHDADEFAAHLSQLLASHERRLYLAAGARQLVAERFSAEICFGPLLRAIAAVP